MNEKKTQDHKTGFSLDAECRRLNKNLIMYHLYKNTKSSDLLRRR